MKLDRILLPTDFSECSEAALDHALFLARHFGAELDLLHVVVLHAEDPYDPAAQFPDAEEIYERTQEMAAGAMRELLGPRPTGELKIREVQRRGISAAPAIVEYAEEAGSDLIVMGAHGRRGFRRFLLGSVAEEVVRLAPCPVLTLREGAENELEPAQKILVPFDFSAHSRAALTTARDLAQTYGGRLHVVHVIEPPMDPEEYVPLGSGARKFEYGQLARRVGEALASEVEEALGAGSDAETAVIDGSAGARISEHAEEIGADLIVVSTHGHTGLRRFFLGSVAEKIVRSAPCPVLTLKAAAG